MNNKQINEITNSIPDIKNENEIECVEGIEYTKNSLTLHDSTIRSTIHSNENKQYYIQPNYQWSGCLLKILMHADMSNYLMATLSTLGGAYHLCNHPNIALNIANRTLYIGHVLGSTKIIIKAHTYRAINYAMLDQHEYSNHIINYCVELTKSNGAASWTDMYSFCRGTQVWIRNYIDLHPVCPVLSNMKLKSKSKLLKNIEN